MGKIIFPKLSCADESGLLALGGDLTVETILTAYSQGIFPWPISKDYPLAWFSPDPRGILFTKDLHLAHSFQKWMKKTKLTVKFNTNFKEIIEHCAQCPNRTTGEQTWIYPEVIDSYCTLFKRSHAYCVGVYDGKLLVGGLYGVKIGKYVSGESMFYLKANASKLALYTLIKKLIEDDIPWVDTQMVTPILNSFGAIEIPRNHFIHLLQQQLPNTIHKSQ